MKKSSTMLFTFPAVMLLSQCTQAGPIDSALDKARNEGRLVIVFTVCGGYLFGRISNR